MTTKNQKQCNCCKIIKNQNEYYSNSTTGKGTCRSCIIIKRKKKKELIQGTSEYKEKRKLQYQKRKDKYKIYTQKNKEKAKNTRYLRQFGISLEERASILEKQNFSCAICKTITPFGVGDFHTDHNHKTGKVRGVLCMKCNHGLGFFQDNIEILQNAIKYLEKEKISFSELVERLIPLS